MFPNGIAGRVGEVRDARPVQFAGLVKKSCLKIFGFFVCVTKGLFYRLSFENSPYLAFGRVPNTRITQILQLAKTRFFKSSYCRYMVDAHILFFLLFSRWKELRFYCFGVNCNHSNIP